MLICSIHGINKNHRNSVIVITYVESWIIIQILVVRPKQMLQPQLQRLFQVQIGFVEGSSAHQIWQWQILLFVVCNQTLASTAKNVTKYNYNYLTWKVFFLLQLHYLGMYVTVKLVLSWRYQYFPDNLDSGSLVQAKTASNPWEYQ